MDEILEAKEKLKKYKKHFDKLNAIEKIEISEEIEKLEMKIVRCENEIDAMVYLLYGLSDEEIMVVELMMLCGALKCTLQMKFYKMENEEMTISRCKFQSHYWLKSQVKQSVQLFHR